ncbi:MAG: hypothetical protein CMD33_08295 [Flavobacteriales bacterium]|nr:hypothetical protein [Flavobacteriales bacterium]
MKRFSLSILVVSALGLVGAAHAQGQSGSTWQPDFNEDRLLSMPDLLPLLGYFGSQWGSSDNGYGHETVSPNIVELDWTGRESETLTLPFAADFIILNPGINDLTDPKQRKISIRHLFVEGCLVGDGSEASPTTIHEALPMKEQVLFMNQGVDLQGTTMPYGARYVLHLPDGSTAEISTNTMGSMSMSGKPVRTKSSLFHAGGRVYFEQ